MEFDEWQNEVIEHKGSVTLRSGRQVGKSTTVGKRTSKLMLDNPGTNSLIIAPSQRQSNQLFIKTMSWLMIEHRKKITESGGYIEKKECSERKNMEMKRIFEYEHGIFAETPTKSTVKLKNGSVCYSLPAGKTGVYLRTFALDFLYIDEAAYVPDSVYTALKPMLAVASKKGLGWECLLSTPFGRGGFFYESFANEDYKQFHINSEDCNRIPKEFLLKEKKRLSRIEYAQEYLGEFIDEFQQFFPTALIKKCMTFIRWDFVENYNRNLKYYEGVDVARYGEDDSAFVIGEMQKDRKKMKIVSVEETQKTSIPETARKIERDNDKFNFNRIFIDDAGLGSGVTDMAIESMGRKVIGLNNAKKTYDHEAEKTNRILKEDLYSNALAMMERGDLELIDDHKLFKSLRCMTFEYTQDRRLRIYGKYSHVSEAFVRACWAVKDQGLKIYVY